MSEENGVNSGTQSSEGSPMEEDGDVYDDEDVYEDEDVYDAEDVARHKIRLSNVFTQTPLEPHDNLCQGIAKKFRTILQYSIRKCEKELKMNLFCSLLSQLSETDDLSDGDVAKLQEIQKKLDAWTKLAKGETELMKRHSALNDKYLTLKEQAVKKKNSFSMEDIKATLQTISKPSEAEQLEEEAEDKLKKINQMRTIMNLISFAGVAVNVHPSIQIAVNNVNEIYFNAKYDL